MAAAVLLQAVAGFAVAHAGHAVFQAAGEAGFLGLLKGVVGIPVGGGINMDVVAADLGLLITHDITAANQNVLVGNQGDLFAGNPAAYGFIVRPPVGTGAGAAGE